MDQPRADVNDSSLRRDIDDPFAVDMFATNSAPDVGGLGTHPTFESSVDVAPVRAAPTWHKRLPKSTGDELALSAALAPPLAPLLPEHSRIISSTIARHTHTTDDEVSFAVVDLREIAPPVYLDADLEEFALHATLQIEPDAAGCFVEFESGFAATLIDVMLGGDGAAPHRRRASEPCQLAFIEFLALDLVCQINRAGGHRLFKFKNVATGKARLRPHGDPADGGVATAYTAARWLCTTVRLRVGEVSGLVRFYSEARALAALRDSQHPLFAAGDSVGHGLRKLSAVLPQAALVVRVGRSQLTRAELAALDHGDTIVLSEPEARREMDRFGGEISVGVGGVEGVRLRGRCEPHAGDGDTRSNEISLRLTSIEQINSQSENERLVMEEISTEATHERIAIDGLRVDVHVALPARSIRLDELASLRVNQVIDLRCSADDIVELVADGRRLARGELVDIDGTLGIRITGLLR